MSHDHPHPEHEQPSAPAPAPVTGDDAGNQALSEALQSSFRVVRFLLLILAVFFLWSGVRTVDQNEVAIKLRFGKPVGLGPEQILKPGLHWALPQPVHEIVKVPMGQSHTVVSSAGWYYVSPEELAAGATPAPKPMLTPLADGYTLTADGNIIHARATLKYRITDPVAYAFRFANFSNLLQNIANNALFYASAHYSAEAALYKDKGGFKDMVLARVNRMIELHQLGIELEPSDVETVPPLYVKEAFEQVQSAENERSKKISDAQGQADEITRKAVGEAQALRNAGAAASNSLVLAVSAEAGYFTNQLAYYRKDPRLFRERLLTERMARVLTNAEDKFFFADRAGDAARTLRLQISREPAKPRAAEPASGATP